MKLINRLEEKLKRARREAEEREAQKKAAKLNLSYLDSSKISIDVDSLALVEEKKAREARLAVIDEKRKQIALIAFDPESQIAKTIVKELEKKGFKIKLFIVSESSLKHIWEFYRFTLRPEEKITGQVKISTEQLIKLSKELKNLAGIKKALGSFNLPTSQILEVILAGALTTESSDIHLEPREQNIRFRLRIDGILHDISENIKPLAYQSLLSRIKLLSALKLNVRNEPQDGRFTITSGETDIEIRTSVIPSEYGEATVMRILDPRTIQVSLEDLGLRQDDLEIINNELMKPNGMILNTGPTGSGKTTTLYAFLKKTYTPEVKIITIEDPIEYRLDGISQTQVEPKSNYTFATGLRSILRQDPDVILVGEIRDLETAEIAMHAALTGHLVFSTLHTNEAADTIPRLIDLGVKPSVIAPAINLTIAQRLVRRLCPNCKKAIKITPKFKQDIEVFIKNLPDRVKKPPIENIKIFQARGCNLCNNLGYKKRIGIFEFLIIDDEIEKLTNQGPTQAALKELAIKKGMATIQQDGILKALEGITSFEEVIHVTGPLSFNI